MESQPRPTQDPPIAFNKLDERTRKIYQHIHRGLHSPGHEVIVVNNKKFRIEIGKEGKRFVRIGGVVFSQHSTAQRTKLAIRARTEPITRVMRSGKKWGWISNTEVIDPSLA